MVAGAVMGIFAAAARMGILVGDGDPKGPFTTDMCPARHLCSATGT